MRKKENTGFICEQCGSQVLPLTNGSYRNHCPFCLYSKHVDNKMGDRLSQCRGLMSPIDLTYTSKKGYQLTHECQSCGKRQKNKVAKDTIQPDELLNWYQDRELKK